MSKPRSIKIPPPPPDYTGLWNRYRWLLALARDGLVSVDDDGVIRVSCRAAARFYTQARRRRDGDQAQRVDERTVRRWADGEQDPSAGASGREPMLYLIAFAHGCDPTWLLGGQS